MSFEQIADIGGAPNVQAVARSRESRPMNGRRKAALGPPPPPSPSPAPSRIWLASALFHLALMLCVIAFVPVVLRRTLGRDPAGIMQLVRVPERRVPLDLPPLPKPDAVETPPELKMTLVEPVPAPEVTFEVSEPEDMDRVALAEHDIRPHGPAVSSSLAVRVNPRRVPVRTAARPAAHSRPIRPVRKPAPPAPPSGSTRAARMRTRLAPKYPERQRRAGRTATVTLELAVGVDGKVRSVRVLSKAIPRDFIRSAVAAARKSRFDPARQNGRAVPGLVRLRVEYRLR